MKLTENEIRSAQRMVARRERDAKSWRWARWLCIVASATVMGCGAWGLWHTQSRIADDNMADLLFSSPATVQGLQFERDAMRQYVDYKLRLSMILSVMQANWLLAIAAAIWGLAVTVAGWNSHLTDALLTKILRDELARQGSDGADA